MNIEINGSCKSSKNKNNCQIKYSDSYNTNKRIKHKRNEEINYIQDNYSNSNLKNSAKNCPKKVTKSKYYLSPQYEKKQNFGINKNINDNDILKLITLTNKLYEDEEHFQKNIINKKNYKNIPPNPRVKMKNFLSGRNNYLLPQKKKISFGLNYKLCKDLIPENSNKNINFRRRLSSNIEPGNLCLFNRGKEKNINNNLLKIKQNLKNLSKERDNSKLFFETQKNNNKYKLNNDNQKQLSRSKTFKQSRNKDDKNYDKIDEKREGTTNRSNKKIKLNKMSTQKVNVNKIDFKKSQLQNEDVNLEESIKNKNKFKKYRKSWCFLCCLNDAPVDSDNEN